MGVSSMTEIFNSALVKCGEEPIISVTDESVRARLLNGCKDRIRRNLLRSHPWKFAQKQIQLTPTVDVPVFDWQYVYNLPHDCVRVLGLPSNSYDLEWNKVGDQVFSNHSPMNILYIRDILDTTKYDDNFVEVLSWAYANEIIYTLTQTASTQERVARGYAEALALARSFNAQEGSVPRVMAEDWLNRRRS